MSSTFNDIALLVLRLAFGGLMLVNHGLGKLEKLTAGGPVQFGDPLGMGPQASLILATSAEFGASILVILGLLTRLATIPLMITMAVAAFIVHGDDPLAKKEMALLYLAAFAALFAAGPGRYSVSGAISHKLPSSGAGGFLLR